MASPYNSPGGFGKKIQTLVGRLLGAPVGAIVACAIVGGVVALAISLLNGREHSATAWLLFEDPGSEVAVGTPRSTAADPKAEAATRERLGSTEAVRNLAAEGLTGEGSADRLDEVEVSAGEGSDLVSVTASDSGAEGAAELANAFAQAYIRFNTQTVGGSIAGAQQRIENAIEADDEGEGEDVRRQELERELERLNTLAAVQGGNPRLIERGEADSAVAGSRHVIRNTLIGAVAGALVGLALWLLVRVTSSALRDPGEIATAYGMALLGSVPESRSLAARRSRERAEGEALAGPAAAAFTLLGARLRRLPPRAETRAVLVTARTPGEGTTAVAWHLAMSFARAGAQTFFCETNLRDPALGTKLQRELSPLPGLAEVLEAEVSFERAVQTVAADDRAEGGATLDVLTAGHAPPDPAELLAGQPMARLVEELAKAYDVVVIDAPPAGSAADAIPLLDIADEVIVVAAAGGSNADDAASFGAALRTLGARTVGLVANRVRSPGLRHP